MNLSQLNNIGVGAIFPIKLTVQKDKDGNPIKIPIKKEDGTIEMVDKMGWYPEASDELIKDNLISIFSYVIGERFRQENFGSRLWECLEEPNTNALQYLIKTFIQASIKTWEPRISMSKITTHRDREKLYILIEARVNGQSLDMTLEYNNSTNTSSYGN